VLLAACGKKGPPLPPLQRIPVAPADFAVSRIDQDVYVQFKVPAVNVDGAGPADVARVEVFAVTADRAPQFRSPEALRRAAKLIASEAVRKPLPPPPAAAEGQPPVPPPPPGPGVDQAAPLVFRETLTPELRVPVALSDDTEQARQEAPQDADVPRPLVAPPDTAGAQRYYVAFGVSDRGRYGPPTAVVPAPLGPTSTAPGRPELTVEETTMTLKWAAPSDARRVQGPGEEGVLPSRPIIPPPPATTYDIYEVRREPPPEGTPTTLPVPLTPAPAVTTEHTQSGITLGTERCFIVRPVDIVSGVHVRGPASEMVCAPFADTFAPAPAKSLEAIASGSVIALLWEASDAKDLEGYLVLRGEAGGATLAVLTPAPVTVTTYRDDTARPGVRYTYAVVAVDKAGNRSPESNRVEETGRQ
jgi:hypothetical protein